MERFLRLAKNGNREEKIPRKELPIHTAKRLKGCSSLDPISWTQPFPIIKIREKPWIMAAISMKHRTVVRKLN